MIRRNPRRIVAGGSAVVSAGASSLTGLLVTIAAATTLDARNFGHFSFVYIVVLTIMTLLRAICGEVVLFTDSTSVMTAARRNSTVTVTGLAMIGALVLVALGATLDPVGYFAAAALVPVCVQDNYRYLAFVARRPGIAAWSDVVTALGPLAIVAAGHGSVDAANAAFLAWGISALAGALLAQLILRPGHGLRPTASFAPALRPLRQAALTEYFSTAMLFQVSLLVLPVVTSYADVGTMRGLQMVFSPVTIVHAALFALLVPRLTAEFEKHREVNSTLVMVYLVALTALTLLIALVVWAVPHEVAERLLGSTGPSVQVNVWAYTFTQLAAVAAAAFTMVRRVSQSYGSVIGARLTSAFVAPFLCLIAARSFGVLGVCMALVAAQVLYLLLAQSGWVLESRARST